MPCLLCLTVLTLSLAKVRAQTGKQEETQGHRDECVLQNISLEHVVSWSHSVVLTINTAWTLFGRSSRYASVGSKFPCALVRSLVWMVQRTGHRSMHLLGFPDLQLKSCSQHMC